MTLEDLDQRLPNGLHDAQIKALLHDYERGVVTLKVAMLVGLPHDPPPERSRYRIGEIHFHGAMFCVIEILENERALGHPRSIWFSYSRTDPGNLPEPIRRQLPPETLCYSLYILDWESTIHIAASDISFQWLESDRTHLDE